MRARQRQRYFLPASCRPLRSKLDRYCCSASVNHLLSSLLLLRLIVVEGWYIRNRQQPTFRIRSSWLRARSLMDVTKSSANLGSSSEFNQASSSARHRIDARIYPVLIRSTYSIRIDSLETLPILARSLLIPSSSVLRVNGDCSQR